MFRSLSQKLPIFGLADANVHQIPFTSSYRQVKFDAILDFGFLTVMITRSYLHAY